MAEDTASGGRDLRNDDFEAADQAYETIRQSAQDVARIARNTGLRAWRVALIKDHLFYRRHRLDDAFRRFDSDPDIVNAWRRMENGAHAAQDVQLMQHELFESHFERLFHTDY